MRFQTFSHLLDCVQQYHGSRNERNHIQFKRFLFHAIDFLLHFCACTSKMQQQFIVLICHVSVCVVICAVRNWPNAAAHSLELDAFGQVLHCPCARQTKRFAFCIEFLLRLNFSLNSNDRTISVFE